MKRNFTVRQGALDGVEAFLSVAQHRNFRKAAADGGDKGNGAFVVSLDADAVALHRDIFPVCGLHLAFLDHAHHPI